MPRRYKHPRQFKPKRSRLKKIFRSKFFWFGLTGIGVFGAAVYGAFFTPWLQIRDITIQGNQQLEQSAVEQVARAHLPRNFMFLATTHFLFVDSVAVARGIQGAFPEIESVVVKKKFPNSLELLVQERKGVAVWCQQRQLRVAFQEEAEETSRSFRECFWLDKRGIVFEEKEPAQEVIVSGEGIVVSLGDRAVDEHTFAGILEFQQALDNSPLFREVGLRVSSLHIISKERVHAIVSEGWEVYFNPAERIDWQITKGKLVLEQEIPFQRRPFLEYVDLRFGDQAYIKYR